MMKSLLVAVAVASGLIAAGNAADNALVVLSADGKLISSEGAKVSSVSARKSAPPYVRFDYEPEKPGMSLKLKVEGLNPKFWTVVSDGWNLGKWLYTDFAQGVDLGVQPAGTYEVGKSGGPTRPKNWDEWKAMLKQVKSTYDGSMQMCYFWAPEKAANEAVPLVVGLHTWSGDWKQTVHYATVLNYAKSKGWAMVGPNFRGPNDHPEACGGDAAVQDIVDAVNFAKSQVKIDASRVYIIGGSGGGHMTLLMAGRHPEIWAGCAAFCPITDIARWHADSSLDHPGRGKNYAVMMEGACGGKPAEKPEEYRHRSPLTWIDRAKAAKVPVYIVTGIHDGWTGSVPVGHSFRAYNALAAAKDAVSEDDITAIETDQKVPAAIAYNGTPDPFYDSARKIHFRRTSENVRFTLFEGGHGGNFPAGLDFLSRQVKGAPADFTLPEKATGSEEKLGK